MKWLDSRQRLAKKLVRVPGQDNRLEFAESCREACGKGLMDNTPVTHNEAKGRFEIEVENQTAFLQYRRASDHISLVHTEVPEALRGRGLGNQLARAALDYAHFNQIKVVAICPFVKAYLQKHPEAQAL